MLGRTNDLFKRGVGVMSFIGMVSLIQWSCAMLGMVQTLYSDNVYPSSFVEFVAELLLASFFVVDCSAVNGHLSVRSCGASF